MEYKRENLSPEQQKVWDYLNRWCKGRDHAVKQRLLAEGFQTSARGIRQMTAELIEKGYPVATTCNAPFGVYVPVTAAEREEYYNNLKSRALSTLRRMKAFKNASAGEVVAEVAEQLELEIFK